MRVGDLVQSNIFDKEGSGSYGLVLGRHEDLPGYWNVQWCSEDWEIAHGIVGIYEISEKDLVVVSEA
tara:strand:+ start:245 stop:445 length:201 start_codon:yes stop_codon:yes gene_type:complete